jgi:hypothetical protein
MVVDRVIVNPGDLAGPAVLLLNGSARDPKEPICAAQAKTVDVLGQRTSDPDGQIRSASP